MNENTLNKFTISGFRGFVETDLTAPVIGSLAIAYGMHLKKITGKENPHIVIGRDGRESGTRIEEMLVTVLTKIGINVTSMGIATTPSIIYSVRNNFDGGIAITASHNPIEYNGLKFFDPKGFFIDHEFVAKMKELITTNDEEKLPVYTGTVGEYVPDPSLVQNYIENISSSFTPLKRKLRIVVDPVNSSASIMAPEFLRILGAEVLTIHDEQNGIFERPPEPNPQALEKLGRAVTGYDADIGFGLDPDGDRLVIVDNTGKVVFEEHTIAICALAVFTKLRDAGVLESAGSFVTNLSTSRASQDIANSFGIKTVFSPVGEPNVVKKMLETNSMIGGEGSGGVIFRPINFCRDSFVGMALVLWLMEHTGTTIQEIAGSIPKYEMIKEKVSNVFDFKRYIPQIKDLFSDAEYDEQDGVRLAFPDDSWLHIRASNTEPIVRIFGESKDKQNLQNMVEKVKMVLIQ